ncbi:MAG: hypothetical protein GEU71_09295 [Actinobacteria bacterium]|nr:hypothetical protein [Actinomycetota bacterium]
MLALLGVLALLAVACGDEETPSGGSGGDSGEITVTAEDFAFSETEISLEPGAEVELTLVNRDDAEHSFTSDDLGVEVEAEGGEEASTTLTAPDEDGTFEFHCEYHPDQMTGTVVVGEGGSSGGSKDSGDSEDLDY